MTMTNALMDILTARALDVELADRLGLSSSNRRGGGEVLTFPFRRNGEVVGKKYRYFDDAEGRRWSQDKGGLRIAWNEDCLRDRTLDRKPLIITEGEFDAIAAIQCGYDRTISVPDGAPPPADRTHDELEEGRKYSWLQDIKPLLHKDHVPEIILAVDGDENGAALLQDLSILLGRFRCKFLTYPVAKNPEGRGRPRLKDLNEVLEDYGLKGVVETISRAQWLKVDGVYRMSELPPLPNSRIFEIGFEAFAEHFKLRLGDTSIWTGTPGSGKTTLVQDIACRCAKSEGLRTAWASFEQAPQRDHRRALREWFCEAREYRLSMTQKAEADAWIDAHNVFLVPNEDDDVTLDWLLEKMEAAVVRFGVQLIVVDPWNEMDHQFDGRAENETQYINRAIKTIKRFARAFQVHIAIVAHPTKMQKGPDGKYPIPSLYDIHGGAVWNNKADLGVIVHRKSENDTLVRTAKSRYHDQIGRPGSVIMQYCGDDRRFRETERLNRITAPTTPDPMNADQQWPPADYEPTAFD